MLTTHSRKNALLALLLLVSAASFGITMALYIAPGSFGQTIFSLCKVWLLALPLVWFIWVDHGKLRLSLPKKKELLAGAVLVSGTRAVILCAMLFTLHHIIALAAYTADWGVVLLGSLGVFIAGAVWSWCYLTYRTLWSSYVSHILADLAIAIVGWHLLFG